MANPSLMAQLVELHEENARLREESRNRPFVAAPAGVQDGWIVEGLVNDIKFKDQEIADLRAKKFARFRNEDCWIYQGDGEDHLESLVCPVVISPQALMELLSAAPAAPADAVAKDAERYRMVRRGQHWSVIDGIGNDLRAEALDAAIDAAMQGKESGNV